MPETLDQLLDAHQQRRTHALVELCEEDGAVHRVHLRAGLVQAVELATQALGFGEVLAADVPLPRTLLEHASRAGLLRRRRIGEVLVTCGLISARTRDDALDRQRLLRLRYLVALRHPRIVVRASVPLPTGASELNPLSASVSIGERAAACALLGLPPRATRADIVRAYRCSVREMHPDRNGGEVSCALGAVLDAYRLLSSVSLAP